MKITSTTMLDAGQVELLVREYMQEKLGDKKIVDIKARGGDVLTGFDTTEIYEFRFDGYQITIEDEI